MSRAQLTSTVEQNTGGAVAPFVAGKNKIINGDFGIWQRGTSFSVGGYTADRWFVDTGTTTRQTGTGQFPYCLQIANTTANPVLRQGFELPFAGNAGQFQIGTTWTVSFYAKTSTSISSQIAVYVAFNDGVNNGTNVVQIAWSTTVGASSTSWTKYTYTFTVASSPAVTNNAVMVVPYLVSGAYAGNFSIAQVQLEAGSVATPFTTATGTLQGELAACQRYYWRAVAGSPYGLLANSGYYVTTTQYAANIQFPVPMRTAATVNDFANLTTQDTTGGLYAFSSGVVDANVSNNFGCSFIGTVSGATAARLGRMLGNNNAAAYLGFGAEL
jgi:hypothetical protein